MSLTITNISALSAAVNLNRNQAALQKSLQRLSTGYRINSAADDPAGLIASESIQAEEASTKAAISNAQRADNGLATVDGALSEVSNLLISLQSLVVASANEAGLSGDEVAANQLQVDSILATVNRVSNTASFGGRKLLSGGYAYRTSGGVNAQALQGLSINAAQVPKGGQGVHVNVVASATHGALVFHGNAGGLSGAVTLNLGGNVGTSQLSLASSTSASQIASAINALSPSTGIVASATGNDVAFISAGLGSSQFVSVQSASSGFQTATLGGTAATRATGRDVQLLINGQSVTGQGLQAHAVTQGFTASFSLAAQQNVTGTAASFTITGGGATFAISPQLDQAGLLSLAINPVNTGALGVTPGASHAYSLADLGSGGLLAMRSGHLDLAQQVVSAAINQVSSSRAQIGATRQYDIQSTVNSLNVKLENLASADSTIRDTNFAAEAATMARAQILVQSSTFALRAAQQSQNLILTLLKT